MSLLYFLSEYNQNHHEGKNDSYNLVEFYKDKYLHFKSKQRVPTKILQQNIYYFSFAKTKQSKNNKITHSLKGNISGIKKLKLMQFNKGSALFKNRIQSLERLISVEKPDILCLSETNLDKNDIQ